ncbi:hypothetical protein ABZ484_21540 [Streptomyces sp. NPDC006393]|uniref:hypothetical protein n=1 Tax=Streptomyces sp. NPDC006393 TaxID=3156763 RepID=UPI0033C272C1
MGQATFPVSLAVTKPFVGRVVVFGAASGEAGLTTHDLIFAHQVQLKGLHGASVTRGRPDPWQTRPRSMAAGKACATPQHPYRT